MIIKYKLVNGMIPTNIVDGGYFFDGEYLYGKGIEIQQDIITKEELLSQILAQHSKTPYKKIEPNSIESINMSVEEVTAMVNAWVNERGE